VSARGANGLDRLIWTAQGDAWQAEGRLRVPHGGGAVELPGVRLMASGLPHAQWNNGDVSDPALVPIDEVRAWYAARAGGAGVPWGMRVPAGAAFGHGRRLFRKRCMCLVPAGLRSGAAPAGMRIRMALAADAGAVADIDAAAFEEPVDRVRPWVEPHLGAPGFTVALATQDGEPAGIATAIRTDERAGSCVGIFGVAVIERARRRGIGGALTSWLLERAFADGATLAHLNPDSDAAARLYDRLGFVETAGLDVYVDL
jgi:ribosomal protein S18 acetylase RimI-like enzyme